MDSQNDTTLRPRVDSFGALSGPPVTVEVIADRDHAGVDAACSHKDPAPACAG